MKSKKRIATLFAVLIVLISVVAAVLCYTPWYKEDKLIESEIAIRREENGYRIIKEEENPLVTVREVTFREMVQSNDTYAYCEVIAEPKKVETFISTGNPILDKKADKKEMTVYTVKVIADSEGIFNENDVITYCYGLAYQDISPKPDVGSKIIIPIKIGFESSSADAYSGFNGYYYITDDGYGIAAFKEDETAVYSGKKVDNLLKSLKKTDAERNAYLAEKKEMYERSSGEYGFDSIEMLRRMIKERIASSYSSAEK